MKVYIAGKISGEDNYKYFFNEAERNLKKKGFTVMNPAVLPYPGFEHNEYMQICFKMIDVCDGICLLPGWEESKGANLEFYHASSTGKLIMNYVDESGLGGIEETKFDEAIENVLLTMGSDTVNVQDFIRVLIERLTTGARHEG